MCVSRWNSSPADPSSFAAVANAPVPNTVTYSLMCPTCALQFDQPTAYCSLDGSKLRRTLTDARIGLRIGPYEILSRIGEGGVGEVFIARHEASGTEVAVKVLRGEMAIQPRIAARFEREARVACSMSHPNVANAREVITGPSGVLYLVMDLIGGVSIRQVLAEQGAMSSSRAGELGIQICDGLDAIHRCGFVHRDIKPSNLMLDMGQFDVPLRIIDFGIVGLPSAAGADARLTVEGQILGTPHYVAPETIQHQEPSPSADLYSVGAVLYEMLTGRPPFHGSVAELLLQHLNRRPTSISHLGPIGQLTMELLHKDPADRPASAADVARRFRQICDEDCGVRPGHRLDKRRATWG